MRIKFTLQPLSTTHVKSSNWLIFLFSILLIGCNGQATPTLYVPPTLDYPSFLPTTIPSSSDEASFTDTPPPKQTPSPDCTPGLTFLEDITIPDGSLVTPKESLDKRWRISNSGTCNWDALYGIQLIAGEKMGAIPEQALFPARSGTQAEVRILFTAPKEPGTYRSAWQAHDPQGNLFGDPIFIEIVVAKP